MASTLTSPVPLRFGQGQQTSNEFRSTEQDRKTPLPQYEKTESVPFTLNLQEDLRNPGQFQLVVNITPKHASANEITLSHATTNAGLLSAKDAPTSAPEMPVLYQTQQSSPTSSPVQDKHGWSDLDAVHPEFLRKVVPDWNVTFSRSDSTASTQSKKLADIKARIKKRGKGYVVRLLKGSTADPNEVAEVDLGQRDNAANDHATHELDSSHLRAELDSTQTMIAPASESVIKSPNVYEIGTSNEPGVSRLQSSAPSRGSPIDVSSCRPAAGNRASIALIAEESLSEAETLISDVRSISGQLDEDQSDLESIFTRQFTFPTRTYSTSSIMRTPTRGLSVVGPVRRVEKSKHIRAKSGSVCVELKRSDARKSVKGHSPRNSPSQSTTEASFRVKEHCTDLFTKGEYARPTLDHSNEHSLSPNDISIRQHTTRNVNFGKPRRLRRLSAEDLHDSLGPKAKLRLQTNVPRPKSTNASPVTRRHKSLRPLRRVPSSSSVSSMDNLERQQRSPEWSEVDPSDELREALGKAFKSVAEIDTDGEESPKAHSRPQIVEPEYQGHIGEIPLPSEIEIRTIPLGLRSPTLKFCGLAISALSEKLHDGFKLLRSMYGAEPPVGAGQVRVRWTCSCGEALYDDFVEKRPNAARLLEAYLNRPRTHTPKRPTSHSSTASSMTSIFDASSRASTLTTPSSTYGGSSSWNKNFDSSKYSPTRLRTNSSFSVGMPTYPEESWLLTCANEGRLTPKIVHLDMNESRIKSDKDLALALREHYDHLNHRWFNWARLRGLTSLEFAQFEVHRNRFADIRATPSMPPRSTASSTSVTDLEKHQSPSQHPYTFEPVDLLPPVGSTYLLHLFKHPSDYDGEMITYLRSPKRRARLEFGMGWGIHLVEGFLAQRVWTVIMSICGLASAAFAVMWTIRKDDVQGAFGVAQWVLGIAALLVGGLQAWLE